jgi:hypothetical protein
MRREGKGVLNKDVHVERISIGLATNGKARIRKESRRRGPVEDSIIEPWDGNETRGARTKTKDRGNEEMDK